MTFLEAVNSIEKKVESLNIRFKDGTPMPPVVAQGKVGKYFGKRYDFAVNSLDNGLVPVSWYYMEMMTMIVQYGARKERTSFDDERPKSA